MRSAKHKQAATMRAKVMTQRKMGERSTASRTPTSAGEIESGNNCSVMNNMFNVFCVHFGGRWGGESLAISISQLRNELRHPKKNVFCT